MTYAEFTERMREEIQARVEGDVMLVNPDRNNGVNVCAISIHTEEGGVAPVVGLKKFYSRYKSGEYSLSIIVEQFIKEYGEIGNAEVDVLSLREFEKIKKRIAYKLINTERNQKLLEGIPHTEILDLSKVYYITIEIGGNRTGTILIHNNFLDIWGITQEQLKEVAEENTPKLSPIGFAPMMDILKDAVIGKAEETELLEQMERESDCKMYVLTNDKGSFGAAVICYDGLLRYLANYLNDDFYILPSSVNEVIILPMRKEDDEQSLGEMVREINESQVPEEEILSDNVYYYSRDTDKLTILTE